ncbi:MAG TPA: excinuclease ABC subunit UvrC [Thermodesulfobacteriota bacterium]|nr:excinuclease ABC subunit UvrC [Thermodesulfobacteriota bacterium]
MDSSRLKQLVAALPHSAGVYLMTDQEGTILYVGKAKDLHKRVSSYLKADGGKTAALIERVEGLDYMITANEKEALILESNLIKKHTPRYNVVLRDDKRYPCLRLSLEEAFPRLQVVRRLKKDKALYFGPFSSAGKMRATIHYLQRIFPLRQCRQKELPQRSRPCLYFQTGRCPGPCHGKISSIEYGQRVREVISFLEGKNRDLIKTLKQQMLQASEDLRFEEAAILRDRVKAISETLKEQKIVSTHFTDADVLALTDQDTVVTAAILFVRLGSVTGMTRFRFKSPARSLEECLSDLIQQFYAKDKYIPQRILVPFPIEEAPLLEEILTETKGKKVEIMVPSRGEGKKWLALAEENCQNFLEKKEAGENYLEKVAEPLRVQLGLKTPPLTVAGLDISNIQGTQAVGSWVVFNQGAPEKKSYRRFRIKTVDHPDDYGMMEEMIRRQASHDPQWPDLLLVDGGKGQLNVLKNVLETIAPEQRPDILALAKKTFLAEGGKDGIYLPGRKNPLRLATDSPILHFLERVRDEAHRFALAYHHKLRQKSLRPGK